MRVSRSSKKKAIVLLSGGIDSAVTLFLAKKKGFDPIALVFDYGQRHKKEIDFAKKLAKKAGCAYRLIKLPFSWKGSSLLDPKKKIPVNHPFKKGVPSTYVPARNLVFLSIATSFAESIKAEAIFIGAHTQDFSGYPDCRKTFFDAFKRTISRGTKDGKAIKILTPLIDKNKKEIVKTGLRLKVPFGLTWSCYKGGRIPCGRCDSCMFRQKAFRELGIKDEGWKEG